MNLDRLVILIKKHINENPDIKRNIGMKEGDTFPSSKFDYPPTPNWKSTNFCPWENYIPEDIRERWDELNYETQCIAYMIASERALADAARDWD